MKKDLQALYTDNEGPDQHAHLCMLIMTFIVNAKQTYGRICRPESESSPRQGMLTGTVFASHTCDQMALFFHVVVQTLSQHHQYKATAHTECQIMIFNKIAYARSTKH